MDHVDTVYAGDADELHRFLLDLADHLRRLRPRVGAVVHHIEDGADLVLAEDQLQFGRIQRLVGIILEGHDGQLDHLARLLFQGHPAQDLLHARLDVRIARNGRGGRIPLLASGQQAKAGHRNNNQTSHI